MYRRERHWKMYYAIHLTWNPQRFRAILSQRDLKKGFFLDTFKHKYSPSGTPEKLIIRLDELLGLYPSV